METLLPDLRNATRRLARSRGLTVVAVVTLALGIGANSAIFSVLSAFLLRFLPFAESDRLDRIYGSIAAPRPVLRMVVGGALALALVSVALIITGVAVAASFLPARRAIRVDPMVALRD